MLTAKERELVKKIIQMAHEGDEVAQELIEETKKKAREFQNMNKKEVI